MVLSDGEEGITEDRVRSSSLVVPAGGVEDGEELEDVHLPRLAVVGLLHGRHHHAAQSPLGDLLHKLRFIASQNVNILNSHAYLIFILVITLICLSYPYVCN